MGTAAVVDLSNT